MTSLRIRNAQARVCVGVSVFREGLPKMIRLVRITTFFHIYANRRRILLNAYRLMQSTPRQRIAAPNALRRSEGMVLVLVIGTQRDGAS